MKTGILKRVGPQGVSWQTGCLWVMGVVLLLGCASGKYKKVKELYDNKDYQQIAESALECSDYSGSCFQIKLLQALSHYQLGNLEEALRYSQGALERQEKARNVESLNQLHLLRARIIFEMLPEITNYADRLQVLTQLEAQLKYTLAKNTGSTEERLLNLQQQELLLWLGETYLAEMEFGNYQDLDTLVQELRDLASSFPVNLHQQGYGQYYLLQGELKSLLPQVNNWMAGGHLAGGREKLLEQLKGIYLQAIHLRRLPLYENHYGEKIEQFLSQLDQYMKGLVL